jgi:competence protein ComEA
MKFHVHRRYYFLSFIILMLLLPAARGAELGKPKPSAGKEVGKASTRRVELNSATKAELEALPGVGPEIAEDIIKARPFQKLEELKEVKGIGEARFDELRKMVVVRPETIQPQKISNPKSAVSAGKGANSERPHAARATKVDLNTASRDQLEALPGIGPEIATALIAARPFQSLDELKDIKGIGEARFEQIRPLVTIHGSDRSSAAGAPAGRTSGAGGKININTAAREQLEDLLGIGPVKAQAIIDHRPYKSVDQLMEVKGIKEGTFAEIKDRITIR